MKKFHFLFLALTIVALQGIAQNHEWADFLYSDYTSYARNVTDMTMDDDGNVYTLGTYERNRIIQGDTIKVHSNAYSCYIMKHNPDGELQWINPIGTNTYDFGYDLIYYNGHLFSTMNLQGDTIYHRDGKLAKGSKDYTVLKLNLDGNLIDTSMYHYEYWFDAMEIVDSTVFLTSRNEIIKLNEELNVIGGLNFNSYSFSFVEIGDLQNVNDTALLLTGTFAGNIDFQGISLTDTFSGEGYAGFIGLLNLDDDLHWLKSFGKIQQKGQSLAYDKQKSKWYLGGNYSTDFELQGHTYPLTKFSGWHGFLASFDFNGNLQETGQVNPIGYSAWVEINDLIASEDRVFAVGDVIYGSVNYNMEDTIETLPNNQFSFVYKLDNSLGFQYDFPIYSEINGAETVTGVVRGEEMYFGGRTHGSGAHLGCDFYETGGYFVTHYEDNEPDETPNVGFGYTPRLNGKYYFSFFGDNYDYHYWDFGDGSPLDSIAIRPIHQYDRKGEINVKFHAGNKCGETVVEKTIRIKGLGALSPGKSANTNLYLGHVRGVGFKEGASLKLVNEQGVEKEIREVVYVDSTLYRIMVEFRDEPLTTYNLYMENDGEKDSLLNALTLEHGQSANIECEWSGPTDVLVFRTFYYTLSVKNTGATTAYSVPVTITGPAKSEMSITTPILKNEVATKWTNIMGGEFREVYLNANQGYVKLASYIIPSLAPGQSYKFQLIVSMNDDSFPILTGYYDPPMLLSQDFFKPDAMPKSTEFDSLICPGNPIIDSLLSMFNIVPDSTAGFNLSSLGCVMYSYLLETFQSLSGFGGSGYGGGNPPNVFVGNNPIPPGSNTPMNMGPIVLESLQTKYPNATNEELLEKYDKVVESIPEAEVSGESSGESVEIEYPENIVCVGDCELSIYWYEYIKCETDEEGVRSCEANTNLVELLPISKKDVPDSENLVGPIEDGEAFLDSIIENTLNLFRPYVLNNRAIWKPNVKASRDPNEKYTIQGYGDENFIQRNQKMPYRITFENADSATAPASEVFIYDTLDLAVLDTNNFVWNSFGWADYNISIEQEGTHVIKEVDLRLYGGNIILQFEGKIVDGVLSATFTSLDTATYILTNNIYDGFLLPNITAPEGEGYIDFSIAQQPNLTHGTKIQNKATIVFDYNEPITTGTTLNTIDTIAPVSSVYADESGNYPDTVATFVIDGFDNGSGISGYKVFLKQNSGAFALLTNNYTKDILQVSASYGDTLSVYVFAEDEVGNVEQKPLVEEATFIIRKSTSINNQNDNANWVNVYPNPAKDILFIKTEQGISIERVRLIDLSGKVVFDEASNHESINISGYYPGVYMLEIMSNHNIYRQKIIFQ